MNTTRHKQVLIEQGDLSADIDARIAPLVLELWKAGFTTTRSCQKHMAGKVWIEFAAPAQLPAFLDIVITARDEDPELWRRATAWTFGDWARTSEPLATVPLAEAWEYHVTIVDEAEDGEGEPFSCFAFGLSVLFPISDLARVIEAVRDYNGALSPD